MTRMHRIALRIYLPTLACLLLASPGAFATPATPELDHTIEAASRAVMQAYAIPGMAIAVTVNGERHYYNFGVASRDSGQSRVPEPPERMTGRMSVMPWFPCWIQALISAAISWVRSCNRPGFPRDSTFSRSSGSVLELRRLKRHSPKSALRPSVWS